VNGEFKELYDKITEWSNGVHNQRHQESLDKFKDLFEKIDILVERLRTLPCSQHTETLKWHSISIKYLWGVLIVSGLLTMAAKCWGLI